MRRIGRNTAVWAILAAALALTACSGEKAQVTVAAVENQKDAEAQQGDAKEDMAEDAVSQEAEEKTLDEPYVLVRETYTKNGTTTEYAYDEKGDLVSETVLYPDKPSESLFREYTTEYREDGSKVVQKAKTMANGEPIGQDHYEYEYNPEGLLIRTTAFSDGEWNGEVLYEYDEAGNLIRQGGEQTYSLGSRMNQELEYDEKGNLVKRTYLSSEGQVEEWETYEYDEDGREILLHVFNAAGEEKNQYERCEWKYEYDDKGRIIEEWKNGIEHGTNYQHTQYKYDEYGNVCKKADLSMNTTYEYMPLSQYLAEKQ